MRRKSLQTDFEFRLAFQIQQVLQRHPITASLLHEQLNEIATTLALSLAADLQKKDAQ